MATRLQLFDRGAKKAPEPDRKDDNDDDIIAAQIRADIISQSSKALFQQIEQDQEHGFATKYSLGKKLGEGMHSSVYRCTLKQS